MTIRPILFSAPMVRALLAGTKTQTRRIMKPQPPPDYPHLIGPAMMAPTVKDRDGNAEPGDDRWMVSTPDGEWGWPIPFAPGDLLWVRETWENAVGNGDVSYRATVHDDTDGAWTDEEIAAIRWRPSIHMPRWASRLTLEVTQVRVERLQDISEADALAEGVEWESADPPFCYVPGIWPHSLTAVGIEVHGPVPHEVRCFSKLWDHINGPGAWAANPWVVAVTFTVHRCNVDQMGPRT